MIIKTFIIGMVLVGIAVILTELHRYMVYSEELERELELERAYDPIALERLLKVDDNE
jgi:hypothetical protein|nr:MAG TPA: hypothetical protein [Caudoviricetes sp.]DAN81810.1 MAG TPA: hypothetical protein [Caudoviricetes sp.]